MSDSLKKWSNELEYVEHRLGKKHSALHASQQMKWKLLKSNKIAADVKEHAISSAKVQILKHRSVYHLMKKCFSTEETQNVVRILTKAGCSGKYINEVIAASTGLCRNQNAW